MATKGTQAVLTALGEIAKRVPWRSEAEERWIFSLLHDYENELRDGETQGDGRQFSNIIPAPVTAATAPIRPGPPAPEAIDYDRLAEAMVRAQARAAGKALPADGQPAEPPPAPPGAARAPEGWTPPAPPEVPPVPVHAGAAAMADPEAVAPPSGGSASTSGQ